MVVAPPNEWDRQTDVVVVGSGTGLAAALAADEGGADVLVLEKSAELGGTTAVSGGGSWVPNSHPVVEAAGAVPQEKLLHYIHRVAGGRTPEEKIERFLDRGPEVYEFIEESTALEFIYTGLPDYHPEFVGGRPEGHMIEPDTYDGDRLGEALEHVRESPQIPLPVPYKEMSEDGPMSTYAMRADYDEISRRMQENVLANGEAFIAGLYEELLDRGVEFERSAPARELVTDGDEVVGVLADVDGTETAIGAGAIVIAAGGLEWDEELRENFLRGPLTGPASPPQNEGDGIEMGADVGAKLGNMNEAWWYPTLGIPGEEWEDGSQIYRIPSDRALPGAIMVNERGDRFVNEAGPYNDIGKAFHEYDPVAYEYRNVPAYQVMDHDFREHYAMGGQVMPEDDVPSWITTADSLTELAEKLGIDTEGLQRTVDEFNEHARNGKDPEFHRGETGFEAHGSDEAADLGNVAPLTEPPFYAFELEPGALGTKGGLVTTVDSEVLDHQEEPISGLFASSNSTAHIMGIGYAGGGAPIGPNVTYGFIAGENAAAYTE